MQLFCKVGKALEGDVVDQAEIPIHTADLALRVPLHGY